MVDIICYGFGFFVGGIVGLVLGKIISDINED